MKIIFSEGPAQYSDYTFNYAVYALPKKEEYNEAYGKGFLPYTGNLELQEPHFYLCRSLRVDLTQFQPGSENRRLMNKLNSGSIQKRMISPSDFLQDAAAFDFCMDYAQERFSADAMSSERMKYILGILDHLAICELSLEGQVLGYIFLVEFGDSSHYWFSFYNLNWNREIPLGKVLMTHMIYDQKEMGKKYIYLGTCYQTKSLYKARDYKGIEFYDGIGWNSSLSELKRLCKQDELPIVITDQLKLNNFALKSL